MVIYLCNGFSESMKKDPNMKEIPIPLTTEEFTQIILNCEYISAIGHEDLATYLTKLVGVEVAYNRRHVRVNYDDYVLLVHLSGRLPEYPTEVEYKNRLNFSLKRFEKQTSEDLLKSSEKIKEIIMEEA